MPVGEVLSVAEPFLEPVFSVKFQKLTFGAVVWLCLCCSGVSGGFALVELSCHVAQEFPVLKPTCWDYFGNIYIIFFPKYHVPFICEDRVAFLLAGFMLPSFCCVSVQVFPLVTVNLSAFPSSTWRCHFLFDDRSSAAQHWNPPGCEQSRG